MIGISSLTFDLAGGIFLRRDQVSPKSLIDNRAGSRRVSRVATLDGGAVVYDSGFSVADRTVDIEIPAPDEALVDAVDYIVQTYTQILLTMRDGAFLATPDNFRLSNGALTFRALITSTV